jgi:hypothetical protein
VEQLAQENRGHESDSVTAAQFLRERMICSPQVARRTSERERGSTAVATQPSLNESCKGFTTLDRGGLSALERRRLELESGAGGDHDLPYWFTGPSSLPQALAWMKLLVRVQDGEWHPWVVLEEYSNTRSKIASRFATSYELRNSQDNRLPQ